MFPLLPFPCCRFHLVASTLSLFYRGVTFKLLTKILAAALLFYNVCSPPSISMLSLPRCCFHVVASTLSLSGTYRDFNLETVLNMADMFYLQIFIIVIFSFLLSFDLWVSPGFPCSTTARRQKVQKPASMALQYYTYWRIIWFNKRLKIIVYLQNIYQLKVSINARIAQSWAASAKSQVTELQLSIFNVMQLKVNSMQALI